MKFLKLLWYFIGPYLRQAAARQVVNKAKRQGVLAYLRALQITRKTLIAAFAMFFLLQSVILAGVGALVTGVWLLELDTESKLTILFITFTTLFVLPVAGLLWFLSERFWYRASGAEKLVEDLQVK